MMLPVVGVMLLIIPWLLSVGVKGEPVEDIAESGAVELNGEQLRLYIIMGVLALLLILNTLSKQIVGFSLNEKMVLLGFGLLMFLPKVGF